MEAKDIISLYPETINAIKIEFVVTAVEDSRGGWQPQILLDNQPIWKGDLQDFQDVAISRAIDRVNLVFTRLFR